MLSKAVSQAVRAYNSAQRTYRPLLRLEIFDKRALFVRKNIFRMGLLLAFAWLIGVEVVRMKSSTQAR